MTLRHDRWGVKMFKVVDYCLCVIFFLKHPHMLVSVSPLIGKDSVCLWVPEVPMLKLLIQVICFSLMQESCEALNEFPGTAVIKYHKPGGLKPQECIISQPWRIEV